MSPTRPEAQVPRLRALVSLLDDSNLPERRMCNVLHFNDPVGADEQSLASDLADVYVDFFNQAQLSSAIQQIDVRFYDLADDEPRPIKGQSIKPAVGGGSPGPREVALCLSFYSERNLPRSRGRLYIGPWATTVMQERPDAGTRDIVAELVPGLTGLGGVDVDWCIYSRVDDELKPVTDWWVDDSWDTQRRRGHEPTARTIGTTSEA
jgi:hypothetical protein